MVVAAVNPSGEMQENDTHNLIADFEQIRQKLNIDKWLLFGGSWGSTLSLAYAQAFPQNISGSDFTRYFPWSAE